MSEFDDKLNALLNDPDSMAQIMQLAQSLSGGTAAPESPKPPPAPPPPPPPAADPLSALAGGLDPNLLGRMLPMLQEFSGGDSSARALLSALRPYLRPERQERIDRALQLARLIHIGKKFLSGWER